MGGENIHEYDGIAHALGKRAEKTDCHCENSAAYAVDYPAGLVDGTCGVVGSHEYCAEHNAAGKHMIYRILTCDKRNHRYGADERQRNMRGYDSADQQI